MIIVTKLREQNFKSNVFKHSKPITYIHLIDAELLQPAALSTLSKYQKTIFTGKEKKIWKQN